MDTLLRSVRAVLWAGLLWIFVAAPAFGSERGADGTFEKRTSSHFILYQDVDIDETSGFRGSRRFEQLVLAALESSYTELDQYTGLRPVRPIDVVVYDPQVYDARFAGLFRFPSAGFFGGRVHIRGDVVVTDRLVRVLRHELFHAALHAQSPTMNHPAWFNEGLAEWFEARAAGKRRLTVGEENALSRAGASGQLLSLNDMSDSNFARLGPGGAQLAYLQSYAFFEYLALAHGERTLADLLGRYLRTGDLDRSFRRIYRADLTKLEERYRNELTAAVRR